MGLRSSRWGVRSASPIDCVHVGHRHVRVLGMAHGGAMMGMECVCLCVSVTVAVPGAQDRLQLNGLVTVYYC